MMFGQRKPNSDQNARQRPRRGRSFRILGSMGVASLLSSLIPGLAVAAVFAASIVGNANVFSSGTLIITGTTGSGTCSSASGSINVNSAACTGSGLASTPLGPSGVTGSMTLAVAGTAAASSSQVRANSCSMQESIAGAGTDVALAYGGVNFSASGPLGGSGVGFDGSSGAFNTVSLVAGPASYSQAVWFKGTGSGSILSFTNAYSSSGATQGDHLAWVDPAGHIVAGIGTTSQQEAVSTGVFNDNTWHLLVVTVAPTGANRGLRVYVDGVLVAQNKSATAAGTFNGYWHIGWSSAISGGWADAPSGAFWAGDLSGVAIFGSALSAGAVSGLYSSASFASYSSGVLADGASNYWALNDAGTTGYTGAVPGVSGLVSLTDASGNSNTGYANGGVSLGVTGPLGGLGISDTGAGGSYVSTTNSYNNPEPGSQSIWFKTSSSGAFMGFSTQQKDTPNPVNFDRMFWVDATGHLVYSIYSAAVSGSYSEVTSPGTYNDNVWHLAVGTYGPSGQELFVDGLLVASSPTAVSAQNYTGWWHLGYAYTNTWANAPTSDYFNGSLAQAAVFPTQLTGSQVGTLYAANSPGAERSAILSLAPSSYWPLDDPVTAPACVSVLASVQVSSGASTNCVFPAGAGACPSLSSANTLASLGTRSIGRLMVGASYSITTNLGVGASLPASLNLARVLVGETYSAQAGSFMASLGYASQVVIL